MARSVRIFWRVFFIGVGLFILLMLLTGLGIFGPMPSLKELENPEITLASEVYGDDGTLMGKYYTESGNRIYVKYKDISKHVIDALVATEDKRFYTHSGIDGTRLTKAVISFGTSGGASTITQQLAKNMLGQGSSNRIERLIEKLKEWIIAVKLERNFTKEEIIALYLNTVSFSDNVYGIRNASRTFFGKEPADLDVKEAAVLVGMVNNPVMYNPRTHYTNSYNRRNTVLSLMATNNYLLPGDAGRLEKDSIKLTYKKIDENNGTAPYLLDVIRNDLRTWCKEHTDTSGRPYNMYKDGLKVYTTINPKMQQYAEEAVAKQLPGMQRVLVAQKAIKTDAVWKAHPDILDNYMKNSDRWRNLKAEGLSDVQIKRTFSQKVPMKVFAWNDKRQKDTVMTPLDSIRYHREMLQTAFMVTDPSTGEIKAWVGGIDFKNYKFDHANLKTKRQVGSSIKPFLYALAVEEFNFTPQTECEATQQYFPGSGYVPARDHGRTGTKTMATGLAWSINEVAAYIIKQTTPERFAEFLKQINIPTKVDPYPSICLGTCDLSLYEMMWGYSMFPNNGFSVKPIYITRIEDKNGKVLARFDTERKEVISQATAYTMTRMMQGPVDFGTAAGLRSRVGVAEMGGKTGTTNDNSDAWFFGFTPQLQAGVWVGCDDRFIRLDGGLGEGGKAARPIWEYFFKKALADKSLQLDKKATFKVPEGVSVTEIAVDKTPPPGAEGEDGANGSADEYLTTPDITPPPVKKDTTKKEVMPPPKKGQ